MTDSNYEDLKIYIIHIISLVERWNQQIVHISIIVKNQLQVSQIVTGFYENMEISWLNGVFFVPPSE
jgi:hypothetical protein